MGPVRPLLLIIGLGEVIVLYWAMLLGFFVHIVFSLNYGSRKRGHGGVVSGYPTSTVFRGLTGCQRTLGFWGVTGCFFKLILAFFHYLCYDFYIIFYNLY